MIRWLFHRLSRASARKQYQEALREYERAKSVGDTRRLHQALFDLQEALHVKLTCGA